MKKIFKYWREGKQRMKEKTKENHRTELHNRFTLTEKNGRVYILCDNTPVYEATLQESTEKVLNRMNEMREAAYRYNKISEQNVPK